MRHSGSFHDHRAVLLGSSGQRMAVRFLLFRYLHNEISSVLELNNCSSYLSGQLTVQSDTYNTRSSMLVSLKRPTAVRAAIAKRSFHSAPALWNSLPPFMRQHASSSDACNTLALSSDQFLALLKTHLFSKSFPP